MASRIALFYCEEGDFEGEISGALHHCDLTSHVLKRTQNDGTVVTIAMDRGED